MLSSAATAALRDIAHHIDLAVQFATGLDYEAFVANRTAKPTSVEGEQLDAPRNARYRRSG
jgi:hypothetical protein